jgi:hypothetical protein
MRSGGWLGARWWWSDALVAAATGCEEPQLLHVATSYAQCGGWADGLYVVRLMLDGHNLGSTKFNVVR